MGPELCAAQVEDQSFFYIEECIDQRVAQEKASIMVITVVSGTVTAKHIELEFMDLIETDTWRWRARLVADGKFLMRFPSAKMASEWSRIKNLIMKNDALIKIESWTPAGGQRGFAVCLVPSEWYSS
jgi:hypothetical protein